MVHTWWYSVLCTLYRVLVQFGVGVGLPYLRSQIEKRRSRKKRIACSVWGQKSQDKCRESQDEAENEHEMNEETNRSPTVSMQSLVYRNSSPEFASHLPGGTAQMESVTVFG